MEDEKKAEVLKDLNIFCENQGISLSDISDILYENNQKVYEQRMHNAVDENKHLVGTAYRERVKPDDGIFPEMYRYYKVISERSSSEDRVSCLVFDEKPYYYFLYQNEHPDGWRYKPGDDYLGRFDFCPVWVEEIPVENGFEKFKVIEATLFDSEFESMWKKISDLEWIPDHARSGKLPEEDGWRISEEEMRKLWRYYKG